MLKTYQVTVTTDSQGDGTGYAGPANGELVRISYVKVDYADGVDFVITTESSSQTVLDVDNVNASATYAPIVGSCGNDGVTIADVYSRYMADDERFLVTVASGGASKSGTFKFIVKE